MRGVDNLLHAVDVGREGRDQDTALGLGKHLCKNVPYCPLAHGEAFTDRVSRIAHQCQHLVTSQFRQALQVDHTAVDGGIVDFKIAGMDQNAGSCENSQSYRIADTMVGVDEFDFHMAEFNDITGHDQTQIDPLDAKFFHFVADQAQCQAGTEDRYMEFTQKIRQRSDVVLMAVR